MGRPEQHKIQRAGWLRAAVLGANDGLVSTSSLIVGVAAAGTSRVDILLVGVAGLVAGAISMAAGEYVSVSSQVDIENADLTVEKKSIEEDYDYEENELAEIYQKRGIDKDLARQVAKQLMAHDALRAHARDELGITDKVRARPVQAALSSAAAFSVGAALPLLIAFTVLRAHLILAVSASSLVFLAILGGVAARAGGASMPVGALRVTFWGALAMALTALVGNLFGVG